MKILILSLLLFVTPINSFSQSVKNVTTTKIYALISRNGKLQDVQNLERLNYFKVTKDKIKFYKGGKVENERIYEVIPASIKPIKGGVKVTTTSFLLGSKEIYHFMLFDNDIIVVSYLGSFYTFHNLSEKDLNQFIDSHL